VTSARTPVVTVLIRVYNGERYLGEAIESVLRQHFSDLELLVIEDGSTDSTAVILEGYTGDRRLRIIRQPNRGLSYSARRGVEEARGAYIAILDADDRSHPDRMEKQVAFLSGHPDHVLVGSALQIIDEAGRPTGYRRYPLEDAAIRKATMLYNPFGHSSICFRRADALACGNYTTEFQGAEDFDFNVRLRTRGKGANLPEALTDYRIHGGSFKAERLRRQLADTIRLRGLIQSRYHYRYSLRARLVDALQRGMLFLPPAVVNRAFQLAFFRSSIALENSTGGIAHIESKSNRP
jgi:glycosyltransferase involved in cell wall biosynthesis